MKSTRMAPMLLLLAFGAALLAFSPVFSDASDRTLHVQFQPEAADTAPDWTSLLSEASLVVRGHVIDTQSAWDARHARIESRHTVAVRYTLLGAAPAQFQVQTIGGVVAREGIGMFESAMPSLATNEEVLLFLAPASGGYVIADDQAGKYTVKATRLLNRITLYSGDLGTVYAAMAAADARVTIPADWAARESSVRPEPVVGGLDYVYSNMKWYTNTVAYRANINSARIDGANGSGVAFLNAIKNAADSWTQVGEADFNVVYTGPTNSTDVGYNSVNEVVFVDKGIIDANGKSMPLAVARVFYIEADRRIVESDIWINDAFEWDATGSPTGMEPDLQSVLTHEFGHWLALGHDSDNRSIMYPTVTLGTTKWQLYDNDRRGITFIYPCPSAQQPCNPLPTPTPTPTITPTPSPTLTPTPSPTPTATPQSVNHTFGPNAGGVLTYRTTAGTVISLTVAAEAVVVTTTFRIEHTTVQDSLPTTEQREVECFAVTREVASEGARQTPDDGWFTAPMTLSVEYVESAIAGLDEQTIVFYVYDAATEAWVEAECAPPIHDEASNRIDAPICAPATFGLFAERLPAVYLPAVIRD